MRYLHGIMLQILTHNKSYLVIQQIILTFDVVFLELIIEATNHDVNVKLTLILMFKSKLK